MNVWRTCVSVSLWTALLAGPLSQQSHSQVSGGTSALLSGEQRRVFVVEPILAACPDTGFDLAFIVGMVYSGLS